MEAAPKTNRTPGATRRRKKRISGEERRRRLIEAAVGLFSRRGFEGAATKQIADAAGVHEVLLFRDFGSKQGLYTAILDHKAKEARTEESLDELRALAARRDDLGFIRCLIVKIIDRYRADPQYQRLLLYAALEGHELSQIFNQTRGRPVFDFLTKYVEQRQADGAFKPGDPRAIAFTLVGLPAYYGIVRRLFNTDAGEVAEDEVIDIFTRVLLDGVIQRDLAGT